MKCSHPVIFKGRVCKCGKCINCRNQKVSEWANRLLLHKRDFKSNCCFITLTYNDSNLPKDTLLHKEDIQKFLKRLRITIQRKYNDKDRKINYFLSGEYGSPKFTERPHYHLILFGLGEWSESIINECWQKGFVKVEKVCYKSCKYVAKYSIKQYQRIKITNKNESASEFVSMSTRPAIAKNWFLKNYDRVVKDDFITIECKKYPIPYYFRKLYKEEDKYNKTQTITFIYNDKDKIQNNIVKYSVMTPEAYEFIQNQYGSQINSVKFLPYSEFKQMLEGNSQKEKNFCAKYHYKGLDYQKYYDAMVQKESIQEIKQNMFDSNIDGYKALAEMSDTPKKIKNQFFKKIKLSDISKKEFLYYYNVNKILFKKNEKILDFLNSNFNIESDNMLLLQKFHNIHYEIKIDIDVLGLFPYILTYNNNNKW